MNRLLLFYFALIGCLPLLNAQDDLVITEIMYNTPGTDSAEFVEIFNNANTAVDLTGYVFRSRFIEFPLPSQSLNPGEYLLLTSDEVVFERAYGITGLNWGTSSLTNGGDSLRLFDVDNTLIDFVFFDDADPWPTSPDGQGTSLVLCDVNTDNNDATNWAAASTPTGYVVNNIDFQANPGAAAQCSDNPIVGFLTAERRVNEADGTVSIQVFIDEGNANETTVTIGANAMASTAINPDDYIIPNPTITFPANVVRDTQTIDIQITNDNIGERIDTLVLNITSTGNNATINPLNEASLIVIVDDEAPTSGSLVISGVFDAQPSGAGAKGMELYALDDIPDLSVFGVSSANNGNGSSFVEFNFPAVSVDAGSCIYIAVDNDNFQAFFGFSADYVNAMAPNINGDDAIELYENGVVVDVFGDVNMDGTGEPWEYLDGWAYRKSATGPDGSTFVLNNWEFSGIDGLEGSPTNANAPVPFPTCTYSEDPPGDLEARNDVVNTVFNTPVTFDPKTNDIINGMLIELAAVDLPTNGSLVANLDFTFTYVPQVDFCGMDMFRYRVCADGLGCDTATVMITVDCPATFPVYPIGLVTADDDQNFVPDSLITCELRGVVYGVDLRGGDGAQFTLIDPTGGIAVFAPAERTYEVSEGDSVHVRGLITQFRGLTQIEPDTIIEISEDNPLLTPRVVTVLDESTESELVELRSVRYVDRSQWTTGTGNGGFSVDVTDGNQTYSIRIDDDVVWYNEVAPNDPMDIVGIGGQFDRDTPADGGYQLVPRFFSDIRPILSNKELVEAQPVEVYPNPTTGQLTIETSRGIDGFAIHNVLGQVVKQVAQRQGVYQVDLSTLPDGLYYLVVEEQETRWTTKVMIVRQ